MPGEQKIKSRKEMSGTGMGGAQGKGYDEAWETKNRADEGYQQNGQYYELWRDEDWAARAREEDWNMVKQGAWSLAEKLEEWRLKVEENKIRGIRKKQVEPEQGGVRNEKEKMWGSRQRHVCPLHNLCVSLDWCSNPLSFAISTPDVHLF